MDLNMRNGIISVTAAAVLGFAFLASVASPVKAGSINDKAVVTFDRPVEVPGKVLLPGTYVFKSLDNEDLVQVFSADGRQLFATVTVIPEDRAAKDTDNGTLVQLGKTRGDAPQEVEGFFLAGHTTGFQFIYPTDTHRR